MMKKNTQFSWRQACDEELGFDGNNPLERGDHSRTKNVRRNPTASEVDSMPQINTINPNAARADILQLGYAKGLLSRNNLRIIDGSLPEPRRDSVDYMQWLRVDYIVFNWICNSMIKEIARGFQNLETSQQLWDELQRRFGKRNGPCIYKLRREIATYNQLSQSIMLHFNNLTSLWDDLALLKNSRSCTCEAQEDIRADLEDEHLMQFLMGLDDSYETIRQQILIMNPLPSLSQAYSMILQVEEQIKGHIKVDCFDIVGIPDWYRKFKADRGKGKAHYALQQEEDAYSVDSELPKVGKARENGNDTLSGVSQFLQTELTKHLSQFFQKGNKGDLPSDGSVNLANMGEIDLGSSPIAYKGHYAFGASAEVEETDWIVDSGASHHIYYNFSLLTDLKRLRHSLQIFIPDDNSVWVFLAGTARI
ncbi:hypothetical protein C2S51_025116 [Perilla frutescens var. frutescens]|nr:hypothetical protein C2S51_025116 [Perilla frutescens var. frutescens]